WEEFPCDPKNPDTDRYTEKICNDMSADSDLSLWCCRGSRSKPNRKKLNDKDWRIYCRDEIGKAMNGEPSKYRYNAHPPTASIGGIKRRDVCTSDLCKEPRPR